MAREPRCPSWTHTQARYPEHHEKAGQLIYDYQGDLGTLRPCMARHRCVLGRGHRDDHQTADGRRWPVDVLTIYGEYRPTQGLVWWEVPVRAYLYQALHPREKQLHDADGTVVARLTEDRVWVGHQTGWKLLVRRNRRWTKDPVHGMRWQPSRGEIGHASRQTARVRRRA